MTDVKIISTNLPAIHIQMNGRCSPGDGKVDGLYFRNNTKHTKLAQKLIGFCKVILIN